MKFSYEDHEQMTVLSLRGELTYEQTGKLRKSILERIDEKKIRDFVIEASELEFIDSEGLETFLWLIEICSENLGQVHLAGAHQNIAKILELTRLTSSFEQHASVQESLKKLMTG